MHEHCRQARVVIGNYAVAVRARQTTSTMHLVRIEMLDPINGDNDALAPILILPDDARPAQAPIAEVKERAQVAGVERIKDTAHLVVARNLPLDPIDAAQIVFLRHALLFEVEQRRGLERKHREGAFQDIRQAVAGIFSPVFGHGLKFAVQLAQQFVKV